MKTSLCLLALLCATPAGALQYPIEYTFRSLTGPAAIGSWLDDDLLLNPDTFNFDRMGFRVEVNGITIERQRDFMSVPSFAVSDDGTMLVNISGGFITVGGPIGSWTFLSGSDGLMTWTVDWLDQAREPHTASGAGLWVRRDLETPAISVQDVGSTFAMLALAMLVITRIDWWRRDRQLRG